MANTIPEGHIHDGYNKKTGRPEFEVTGEGPDAISDLLGVSPTAKLWSLLFEWSDDFDGTMTDLANCSGIGRTSLYKIITIFLNNEWIIPSKYEKGVQYYKFNMANPVVYDMSALMRKFMLIDIELTVAKENAMDKVMETLRQKKKKKK